MTLDQWAKLAKLALLASEESFRQLTDAALAEGRTMDALVYDGFADYLKGIAAQCPVQL